MIKRDGYHGGEGNNKKRTSCKRTNITFVKEGARSENKKRWKASILDRGGDWELRVDMGRKLVFLEIVDTTLRPDMMLWSRQANTIIELTVPWEENYDEAHQRKSLTYTYVIPDCKEKDGKQYCFIYRSGEEVSQQNMYGSFFRLWECHYHCGEQQYTTISRYIREGIMLGMEQTRGAKLEVWNQRVVVWPPLLTHQLEDVIV